KESPCSSEGSAACPASAKLKIMMPKMPSETSASGTNSAVCLMTQKKRHRQTETAAIAAKDASRELSRVTVLRASVSLPMTGGRLMPEKEELVSKWMVTTCAAARG